MTLITESLFCALKRIRQRESSAKPQLVLIDNLCADAVCIDQDNDSEKGHQMALMSEIFAHSKRLLIWPGEASDIEISDLKTMMRCTDNVNKQSPVILGILQRT